MNSQKITTNDTYVAMWDIYGLEAVINVSAGEREAIANVLRGEKIIWHNPIQYMILRAKFNAQRHYEIYSFTSEMSEQEIRELFTSEPQLMADTIRRIGNKIYSDRECRERLIT